MLKLTRSKYRVLSNICEGIGQVFFGGVIAGFVVLSLDVSKALVLISELMLASEFWYLSLYFGERGKL